MMVLLPYENACACESVCVAQSVHECLCVCDDGCVRGGVHVYAHVCVQRCAYVHASVCVYVSEHACDHWCVGDSECDVCVYDAADGLLSSHDEDLEHPGKEKMP